jgi:hypothetical protein
MRESVHRGLTWLVTQARAIRQIPRIVLSWLRSNIARCLASVWLTGVVVFAGTTVRRVRAAQAADPPAAASAAQRTDGPGERLVMLDVDEINGIRIQRLHALGLAAAGDTDEAPDQKTIDAAREARARTVEIDGEQVATAGSVTVVTRGGIAGWLKRNRGKKADPETLAWLRGQEAAEGGEAYAGWADRDDASILNWARSRRKAAAGGSAAAETADTTPGQDKLLTSHEPTPDHTTGSAAPSAGSADTAAPPATPTAARAPAVRGFALPALGVAAAAALAPHPPVDPSPDQIAALRAQIKAFAPNGAIAASVRDHNVVLLLLCDQLFEPDHPELTPQGLAIVRSLSRVLTGDRSRSYRVIVDRDRAFELVSNLAIGGLPAERLEIALKEVDGAIDVAEIESIDLNGAP